MKVFTVGGATQDIFIHYQNPESLIIKNNRETRSYLLLEKGAKIEVEELTYSTGGGATNSAVSFKKLGFDVSPIIKIGIGKAGQYIQDQLEALDIDCSFITKDKSVGTGLSYIIPSFEGDRTIFAYRGANKKLTKNNIPFDAIKTGTFLYITSLSGDSSKMLVPLAIHAKKERVPVAVNPGISQLSSGCKDLARALKDIDIFILNSHEAKIFLQSMSKQLSPKELEKDIQSHVSFEKLPDLIKSLVYIENVCFNLKDFCKEIMSRGPSTVVVTNGEEGVYVAHKKTIYFFPSIPTEIIDTVGAGDAFGSCFSASIFKGLKIEEALINGMINASSVISFEDAKNGLLGWKEIEQKKQKINKILMKKFKV
ncbi:TPA: carbohydrate kinase [Candidatus Dependentiae bacterium]|nr:MAG: Ribokinase [candidate division TM6 bacterium GW2011_GWF2_36_131]KKQ03781.1 MAG: Ribokinase [candidate division TM6 bacterium GW2011_GWE2_36_25]KKQ19927.1 MAG: Ribokinase [candidate division TM6 bacterium GW2011_GWA2_36_9]HBR70547.1 carbohydrate kinase [Candidatus Dependentiae bacterium]HCU00737.1 carbohydrate kinase [Candidatus Dependentiae bacterium]